MPHTRLNVAVVGAGLAGLSCARHLQNAGCRVTLFEKARGPGGRMSTRRADGWQCDHGAQYFTVRDNAFRDEVARWEAAGVAALWEPRIAVIGGGRVEPDGVARFVGVPRMSAPAAWLAAGLQVHSGVTITRMHHEADGWRLHSAEQGLHVEHYDALVLAVPAPQAAALLEPLLPLTAMQSNAVAMLPSWTLMLRFARPYKPGYDAAFINDGPLRWVARDSSKPGRTGSEVWVLQAAAEWSAAHVEDDESTVTALLLEAFAALGGPAPDAVTAHRWRYAKAGEPSSRQAVWLPAVRVGLCGDWLGGGRVEDAWLSGQSLAAEVLTKTPCLP